jgi:hypothetical protein
VEFSEEKITNSRFVYSFRDQQYAVLAFSEFANGRAHITCPILCYQAKGKRNDGVALLNCALKTRGTIGVIRINQTEATITMNVDSELVSRHKPRSYAQCNHDARMAKAYDFRSCVGGTRFIVEIELSARQEENQIHIEGHIVTADQAPQTDTGALRFHLEMYDSSIGKWVPLFKNTQFEAFEWGQSVVLSDGLKRNFRAVLSKKD